MPQWSLDVRCRGRSGPRKRMARLPKLDRRGHRGTENYGDSALNLFSVFVEVFELSALWGGSVILRGCLRSRRGRFWGRHQLDGSASVVYMARSEGFEPPALGIEIRCSIQLSYERVRALGYQSCRGSSTCRSRRMPGNGGKNDRRGGIFGPIRMLNEFPTH